LQWRNFIIVIIFIFLMGIIIGLLITPHPDFQNKTEPDEIIKQASVLDCIAPVDGSI
jgi:hypothetical protein